ncbi:50S ribosomal protein L31 [Buchnera aphidicola str. Bp (Baizongia pistaciae)]|uniref:Large ribosomal subunit protein bL31 n=1 Tax=Buchnera aphidicola subsp. Baizongia pistaciae (strain Bp) TaxID=224915 RepID=RL31_BUCBP|nr:50S ribosomal protein L31 [Buchnera aphidicola]Q89A32.1 RecName: Full=Large ribosomal subunit protein bL31; AltName: Full=50S ribosomal protein L31 [Buchnera aphidicola str. Bp (Baizongia pistaciae)]AAO27224.1 50S ribosomal protein L31 [Buchnera aphidicola str. Bp (Baizongia pistaciae)]
MKKKIHPDYFKINVTCSCGNNINIFSTLSKNINVDVCSKCHPFYTGQQRTSDTGGRIEKFHKRFNISSH